MGYIFQPVSSATETFPSALSVMVGIWLRKHGRKMERSREEDGNVGCGRDTICPARGTQAWLEEAALGFFFFWLGDMMDKVCEEQ